MGSSIMRTLSEQLDTILSFDDSQLEELRKGKNAIAIEKLVNEHEFDFTTNEARLYGTNGSTIIMLENDIWTIQKDNATQSTTNPDEVLEMI